MSSEIKSMRPFSGPGKIPYRIFWTWDHSTNWCMNTRGAQNSGVANAYMKNPEMFLKDYMRVVDWCAENGMNAVGIVGLLRDRHGGVDSVRKLCAYAQEKGICIYIIAGLFAYSGIYYEGDSPYNLNKFFDKNPQCIGQYADGRPLIVKYYGSGGHKIDPQGCPSNPQLKEYVLESLDWLFKEIPELGGIQMEAGDNGVCQCPKCQERRGIVQSYMSLADMAGIYPQGAEVVWGRKPDALVICETYHHFQEEEACAIFDSKEPSEDLQRLLAMPEKTFWQWKCDQALADNTWQLGAKIPASMRKFHHIMRSHAGTQWWGGRHTLDIEKIRRQCMLSFDAGIDTVSMFGEQAPYHTNAEFNYLALQYFSDAPFAKLDSFVEDVMAPRLGGREIAFRYLEMAGLYRKPEKIPAACAEIAKIAAGMTDYEALRRWQYLSSFLNSYCWEAGQEQYGISTDMKSRDIPAQDAE